MGENEGVRDSFLYLVVLYLLYNGVEESSSRRVPLPTASVYSCQTDTVPSPSLSKISLLPPHLITTTDTAPAW